MSGSFNQNHNWTETPRHSLGWAGLGCHREETELIIRKHPKPHHGNQWDWNKNKHTHTGPNGQESSYTTILQWISELNIIYSWKEQNSEFSSATTVYDVDFPPRFGYNNVLSSELSRLTPRCGGGIFMSIFSFAYNLAPPGGGQTGKVILWYWYTRDIRDIRDINTSPDISQSRQNMINVKNCPALLTILLNTHYTLYTV